METLVYLCEDVGSGVKRKEVVDLRMINSDHYFGARSFSKPRATEVNGFIENVDRDLRKFYHTHQRSVCVAYVLAVCLGMFGVHHFYLGRKWYGVMYLCTFGLFGVGYVVDLFRLARLVRDANIRRIDEEEDRTLMDLYVLWFPCGILGKLISQYMLLLSPC